MLAGDGDRLNACEPHAAYYQARCSALSWHVLVGLYNADATVKADFDKGFESFRKGEAPVDETKTVQTSSENSSRVEFRFTVMSESDMDKATGQFEKGKALLHGIPTVELRLPKLAGLGVAPEKLYVFPYDHTSSYPTWILSRGQNETLFKPLLRAGTEAFTTYPEAVLSETTDTQYKAIGIDDWEVWPSVTLDTLDERVEKKAEERAAKRSKKAEADASKPVSTQHVKPLGSPAPSRASSQVFSPAPAGPLVGLAITPPGCGISRLRGCVFGR